jgi:aerobic carbon-monoxide dehydrogenase medium subunit
VAPFNYHRPGSVAEAVALLSARSEGKLLAGGQSLLPTLRLRLAAPTDLIDLGHIAELRGIRATADEISIGAMTRHNDVAASREIAQAIPALARLAGHIGDRQIRNLGTLGGSLANNDPAACYPAAALGLAATIRTSRRSVAAHEFLRGMYETCLDPDEIVTSVSFKIPSKAAYLKFMHPASRFALVGVFVAERAGEVRVAVTGAGLRGAFRSQALESALQHSFSVESIDAVAPDAEELSSDLHASADYRAHLIKVMARRAVAQMTAAD